MKHHTRLALLGLSLLCASGLPAGELTERMNLTLDRVRHGGPPVYTDALVLADAAPHHTRRFTEFSGDVSGRYLGALAAVTELTGQPFPELERIAAQIPPLQKADGHFGDPFSTNAVTCGDMALLWGNGRMLIGLLEYHRIKPDARILECARKLGDCFVALGPRMNDAKVRAEYSGEQVAVGYICWTQIIEGLVELSRVTQDEKYLRLAEQIAGHTHRHPHQHSHGFVSALRGILDLYRVTHDAQWLRKVEAEWEGILASGNLLPHGALPEIFQPLMPEPNDEGCSEADWLRLNLGLWTQTRNPRYLENAELTLFNEFFLNQFSTGDFGHHRLSPDGVAAWHARAWWCCTFHGLRAFPEVARAAFHTAAAQLSYDLPVDGQGVTAGLTLQADATLAQNAMVKMTALKADAAEHTLRLRQPAWAAALELQLNGQPLSGTPRAGGVEIRRTWQAGDQLTIRYALRTRLLPHPQNTKQVALLRGPWLLGANTQQAPTFFDSPHTLNRVCLPALDARGDMPLPPVTSPAHRFTAPAGHVALRYLPGGYPMQPQTVTLRPIAEHTALADGTAWVFWFQPQ
jgi:DUF1680 family protein